MCEAEAEPVLLRDQTQIIFIFTTFDGAPVDESECSCVIAAAGYRGTRGKGVIYLVFVGISCSAGVS